MAKTQGEAFHSIPIATPTKPPMKAVNEDRKFIINACLIDSPELMSTAKSPKNERT